MGESRRGFLGRLAALPAAASLLAGRALAAPPKTSRPVVVSTWPFGVPANDVAWRSIADRAPLLDACIAGVTVVERDPKVMSVGYGGLPNSLGVVQLDACVMDGATAACGAVASLEDVATPAAVAQRVMEHTPHILLVGPGARAFAVAQGFPTQDLLTPDARLRFERWRTGQRPPGPAPGAEPPHDTIGLIAVDADGHLAGVCSTSGLAWKAPGRVGDSPLIGDGLFVDDDVGAAAATGVGEEVIRTCGSHTVVERMRAGRSPAQACEDACRRIIDANRRRRGRKDVPGVAFIALDRAGRVGACSVHKGYFQYAVTRAGKTALLDAPGILPPLPG